MIKKQEFRVGQKVQVTAPQYGIGLVPTVGQVGSVAAKYSKSEIYVVRICGALASVDGSDLKKIISD